MTSEVVIAALADKAAPKDYTVASSQQIIPLCITASLDGSGAASSYLATVELISDAGLVIARCPCQTTIAAGASADVSWFPLTKASTTTSSVSEYQNLIGSTQNIRSYWPLDETSGTQFQDLGPSSKPMVIQGSPTLGNTPLITTGHSAVFPNGGSGGGIPTEWAKTATGYGTWGGDGSLTVEAWIKTSATSGSFWSIISSDDNNKRLFDFGLTSAGKLQFATFDSAGTTPTTAFGASTLNTGATFYVAGTFDGTTHVLTVYVNSVADGTATSLSSYTGDTVSANIAARFTTFPGSAFSGIVDEVALYNRALTATEIAQHYTTGIT